MNDGAPATVFVRMFLVLDGSDASRAGHLIPRSNDDEADSVCGLLHQPPSLTVQVDVASRKLLALKQGLEWAAIEPRGRSFAYRYVSIPGGA
ncbi:unnamed protein product [Clonostachys rosea]|uniref:HNH nuclease domain-containing protein n=1 Tax=Bionectria ochroleuca TaxID=29856 RepID=A0ABY6UML6_BIOOC|nr:unnamed protein product [Clonostachys rosea]